LRAILRLVLLAMLCAAGCLVGPSTSALPPTLQTGVTRLPIRGGVSWFRHTVKFGPYVARNASTGLMRPDIESARPRNDHVETAVYRQKASFELYTRDQRIVTGVCSREETIRSQHFPSGVFGLGDDEQPPEIIDQQHRTLCTLTRSGAGRLDFTASGEGAGVVRGGGAALTFSPLASLASPYETPAESYGFSVEANGVSIAAIDLTGARAMTYRRDLPPSLRHDAVAVCMALYLTTLLETRLEGASD
jgi:hypothetical protein